MHNPSILVQLTNPQGLVNKSVEDSETTNWALDFGKILAEKHFSALKPTIEEMQKREAVAVKKVIAAYSNATGGEEKVDELEDKADDSN